MRSLAKNCEGIAVGRPDVHRIAKHRLSQTQKISGFRGGTMLLIEQESS
jgi:hypothetical protein